MMTFQAADCLMFALQDIAGALVVEIRKPVSTIMANQAVFREILSVLGDKIGIKYCMAIGAV